MNNNPKIIIYKDRINKRYVYLARTVNSIQHTVTFISNNINAFGNNPLHTTMHVSVKIS